MIDQESAPADRLAQTLAIEMVVDQQTRLDVSAGRPEATVRGPQALAGKPVCFQQQRRDLSARAVPRTCRRRQSP